MVLRFCIATSAHSMTNTLRFSILLVLSLGLLEVFSPSSANGQSRTYERGETVQVPAPIGFSDSKLGVGKPVGGSSFSTTEVVSSEGKITSVDDDAYEAKLQLQRSQF